MNKDLENLLEEIRAYRDSMVARNYPFQEISNIIIKWEKKKGKTVSEELQSELEPIDEAEQEKKELENE